MSKAATKAKAKTVDVRNIFAEQCAKTVDFVIAEYERSEAVIQNRIDEINALLDGMEEREKAATAFIAAARTDLPRLIGALRVAMRDAEVRFCVGNPNPFGLRKHEQRAEHLKSILAALVGAGR